MCLLVGLVSVIVVDMSTDYMIGLGMEAARRCTKTRLWSCVSIGNLLR